MEKGYSILLLTLAVLLILYAIGPSPDDPLLDKQLPKVPGGAADLERFVRRREARHKLKPDNEARIVWANDSSRSRTKYSIVYMHGFSASQEEGNPVHRAIAKEFECNLYLSRLAEHGIDTVEPLMNLTADNLWESAKMALSIGKQLGERVILMGTSTGGTLALALAAAFPEDVAGLVLYSPNIEINDPAAFLINNPWGLQVARLVKGGKYNVPPDDRPVYKQYWNRPYRLEAVAALQELLETTMHENTFKAVHQPTLALYYYKDETHQDEVVKVSAIREMMEQLGTPAEKKRAIALPDVQDHVLASPIRSKDVAAVQRETEFFLKEVMSLPVKK